MLGGSLEPAEKEQHSLHREWHEMGSSQQAPVRVHGGSLRGSWVMKSYHKELKHRQGHSWQEAWGLCRPTSLIFFFYYFISFFYCCQQITASLVFYTNTDLFSHEFGGQRSKISILGRNQDVSKAVLLLEAPGEESGPCSFNFWRGCRPSLACSCISPISASMSHDLLLFCPHPLPPSYKDT